MKLFQLAPQAMHNRIEGVRAEVQPSTGAQAWQSPRCSHPPKHAEGIVCCSRRGAIVQRRLTAQDEEPGWGSQH